LRGYSHVFVSGPTDVTVSNEQQIIPRLPHCMQEVFNRETVRALLLAYEAGQPLLSIRESLGDDRPWRSGHGQKPTKPVSWLAGGGVWAEEAAVTVADLMARNASAKVVTTVASLAQDGSAPQRPESESSQKAGDLSGGSEAPVRTDSDTAAGSDDERVRSSAG